MAKKIEHLDQLFERGLQEIIADEKHLQEALPRFGQAARSQVLKELFQRTEAKSRSIVKELEELIGDHSKLKRKAFRAIIEEGERKIKEIADIHLLDVELVSIAQRLLGFQIASYHSILLQSRLLKRTGHTLICLSAIDEKRATLKTLEEIAVHQIYWQASWWSPEKNSAWGKFKTFLRDDWERTKDHLGVSDENDNSKAEQDQKFEKGEGSYRYGYGAALYYHDREWDDEMRQHLKAKYGGLWDDSTAAKVEKGWNYAITKSDT